MDYLRFERTLQSHRLTLFTLQDIQYLFPGQKVKTIKNNLGRWLAKGYCRRLKRNLYELLEPGKHANPPDFLLANRLYSPSYVSLETALSFYGMIPEVAASVTSVTTRPTRTFKNRYGSFYYRTCKPSAFTGYGLVVYEGAKVAMADREKALVDFLYFRARSGHLFSTKEDRWSRPLLQKLRWRRAFQYAALFNPRIVRAVRQCKKEFVTC